MYITLFGIGIITLLVVIPIALVSVIMWPKDPE